MVNHNPNWFTFAAFAVCDCDSYVSDPFQLFSWCVNNAPRHVSIVRAQVSAKRKAVLNPLWLLAMFLFFQRKKFTRKPIHRNQVWNWVDELKTEKKKRCLKMHSPILDTFPATANRNRSLLPIRAFAFLIDKRMKRARFQLMHFFHFIIIFLTFVLSWHCRWSADVCFFCIVFSAAHFPLSPDANTVTIFFPSAARRNDFS